MSNFFKDLKDSLGDAAQMGKNAVNRQRAPQGMGAPGQGMPPQAAPMPESYPGGLPNAPSPVPPGGAYETVLLRAAANHIYPNGEADHGMAVLTNYRLAYFQTSGVKALFADVSANTKGRFVFDLPLGAIAKAEQELRPHPWKSEGLYPFLVLSTAEGKRFALYVENLPLWQHAVQTEAARAAALAAQKGEDGKTETQG